MSELIIFWLPLSLSSAALVGLLVVLIAVVRSRDDQRKLLTVLDQVRKERSSADSYRDNYEQQFQAVADQVASLKVETAQKGQQLEQALEKKLTEQLAQVAHRQASLEQQLLQQQEAIQEVADQDLESKFYQRAARLVQQGATLEEIMEACELPRAEAELLYNLYKK